MSQETEKIVKDNETFIESKISTTKKPKIVLDGDVIVKGNIKASGDVQVMSSSEEMTEVLNKTYPGGSKSLDQSLNIENPMNSIITSPAPEGIKFAMTRNVKHPNRANASDAGIDFYVPKFDAYMVQSLINSNPLIRADRFVDYVNNMTIDGQIKKYFLLHPHERILIPSGIKCQMCYGDRALIAFNKSGVSTKHGLTVGACVVDKEYQGEIHISLINTSTQPVVIYEDMKAVQFIEIPIYLSPIQFVEVEELHQKTSTRGTKGFGDHDSI